MTPSISTTLETLRSELASRTQSSVFIGAPDDHEPGLYVFPLHHGISPALRPFASAPAARARRPGYSLECLMLAAPGGDLGVIDKAASFLHEHPVLEVDSTVAQLIVSDDSPSETASVFLAAAISYRLYIRFRIRVEPAPAGA